MKQFVRRRAWGVEMYYKQRHGWGTYRVYADRWRAEDDIARMRAVGAKARLSVYFRGDDWDADEEPEEAE